ncbi:MAG: FKBP-type peptidyl-prolyl cis-trans isomerase [Actinomycetia bacterium]|nr:FKBP-type peptidyl-prolyl cis-trans isomerase [Actinomycetes bacterium]
MPTSRFPRLVALAAAAALALSACGESTDPSAAASGLDEVSVSESPDGTTAPEVTFEPGSISVETTVDHVVTEGDGQVLGDSDLISFNYVVHSAQTGEQLGTSYTTNPIGLDLADPTLLAGLKSGLVGQQVGSLVLLALPADEAFGEGGNEQLGVGADETLLFVVDVLAASTPLTEATGTEVTPQEGLPTVTMVDGEPAQITIPEGFEDPETTQVQLLIEGEGPEVAAGQTLRAAYTGVTARDGEVFDSSATATPPHAEFPIGVGRVIAGWDSGLVGQKVGSRVLLVIPSDEGYGDAGREPSIQGGDTLVFVVDILAAY